MQAAPSASPPAKPTAANWPWKDAEGKDTLPPAPQPKTASPQPGDANWDRAGAVAARQTAADLATHHAKLRDVNIAKANSYSHPDAKAKPQARANYHHARSQEFAKERDQHTANIERHKAKMPGGAVESVKATANKLVELQIPSAGATALRGKDLANIFSAAAAYAHDKDMVSSKVQQQTGVAAAASLPQSGPSPGGGNTSGGFADVGQYYGGGQGGNFQQWATGTPPDKQKTGGDPNTVLINKVIAHLGKNGLSADAIQKLRGNLRSVKDYSAVPNDVKNTLGLIGFAFLKSV
jgi:hypothetical protein